MTFIGCSVSQKCLFGVRASVLLGLKMEVAQLDIVEYICSFNMKKKNVPVSSYFLAYMEQFQCIKV